MPPRSGTVLSHVPNPTTLNPSKNELFISSSISPVACHTLFVANLTSLIDRRDKLSRTFFQTCATRLPVSITFFHPIAASRLRSCTPLPRPTSCTKKFQSFINFALNNYQSSMQYPVAALFFIVLLLLSLLLHVCALVLYSIVI